MNELLELDKQAFYYINTVGTDPWLDRIFPIITDLHTHLWFMAGVVPLIFAIYIWKQKMKAVKAIVLIALSIALADAVSYRVVKPLVDRERPANSEMKVQLRTHPHSGKSFPSNHAANNFAAAMTLALIHPTAKIAFFGIAFIVSYSRIYVGVHYPLDVIGGAIIGMFLAYFIWTVIGNPWVNKRKKSTRPRGIPRDPFAKRHPRHRFDR